MIHTVEIQIMMAVLHLPHQEIGDISDLMVKVILIIDIMV